MKIIWVDHGIASSHQDGHIEMNENLKRYPVLMDDVMRHEMEHLKSDKPVDIWIDLKNLLDVRKQARLSLFCLRHPKALTEMLPAFRDYKGNLAVNYGIAFVYLLSLSVLLVT